MLQNLSIALASRTGDNNYDDLWNQLFDLCIEQRKS